MQPKLLVMKLILDELGVGTNIDTVADRVRIQKALYLTQRAGVDFGYRYGWYKRGPYSSRLATDYYRLQNELTMDPPAPGEELVPSIKRALERIQPLFRVPKDVELTDEKWLELLASFDFLTHEQKEPPERAAQVIGDQKQDLARFINRAQDSLQGAFLTE